MFVNRFLLRQLSDVIDDFETSLDRMPIVLRRQFRQNKTGKRDRSWVRERAYLYLRHRLLVTFLSNGGGSPAETVSRLYSEQDPDGFMRRLLTLSRLNASDAETLHHSFPPRLSREISAVFPGREHTVKSWLNTRAAPVIRINPQKTSRNAVQKHLREKENIQSDSTDISPFGLLIRSNGEKLSRTEAFAAGHFELQDESSQLTAYLVSPRTNTLLDACAGGGGKSLAIAALRPDIQIMATDIRTELSGEIRKRCHRAGCDSIQVQSPQAACKAQYNTVVVDAPCSGSGVLRRNPDDKWRYDENDFATLNKTQQECLDRYSSAVAPGGELIYITCSFTETENHEQVRRFLRKHTDFSLFSVHSRLESTFSRLQTDRIEKITAGDFFFTQPGCERDVFFAAVMKRS